jgi:poly(3-hydroxybutyrate) depolymerase
VRAQLRVSLLPVAVAALVVLALTGMAVTGRLGGTALADAHPLAATAGCDKAPTLTSGTHSIQSGGQNRSYILRVPANYDNTHPYRLVFGFHWLGGTANDVDSGGTDGYNWSYYGLRRLADNAGNSTIFVAPQGLNNGWANSGGQDVTFVDDMLAQLEAGLCVDTTQIFSAGFSYGAAMSYALACARPTVFRAVAVYSGANLSGCSGGTQPVAYIGLHGIRDNVLPISNGRALRDTFVRNDGCTSQNPPEPAYGSLTHIVTAYSGCRAGYPVEWAAFDGAGHDPGPIDGCTCDGWMTWTKDVVWSFFTQFQSGLPPSTPPASSPPPTGQQNVMVVGQQSGRCIDINASTTANGTQAQLWDCTGGTNQRWTYTTTKQLTVYGNKCLDASGQGTTNGTAAIIWDCNGQPNQQWNVNANGTITGVQSGLCLDATGQNSANGTKIQLWTCTGAANQQWSFRN